MKKMYWEYVKRYGMLVVTVLFSILAVSTFCNDIGGNALKTAKSNLSNDAEMFTSYVDDTVENRLNHLRQLAKTIDVAIYQDSELTNESLKNYKGLFSSLTVLTTTGAKEYGDHITLRLDSEEILEELVYDRKAVVYSDSIKEVSGKDVIVMAVPIETDGKVGGIVVGTLSVSVLNDVMDTWGYSQSGCAFLITTNGKYVTRGDRFDEILGGKANSFFTYLANSALSGDYASLRDVEHEMASRKQIALEYSYSGIDYIGALEPSVYKSWYVGFVEETDVSRRANISMEKGTIIILVFALLMWMSWIAVLIILMLRNTKFKAELERYYILNQMERSLIFELQFEPKQLSFYGDSMGMFGMEAKTMFGEEVYEVYQYIHEDDKSVRGRIHRFYDDDSKKFSAEIRIRNNSPSGYGWYRISGILVKDQKYGVNEKFIGKVEDVNQQIVEEKSLVERAENDLLTGVLNKKTMEEKVTECLQNISGNTNYIFFMIDLDNFKNVNDKLGHIFGDKAIIDTAKLLSEIFSKNAFVGRLGGDEFAVCAAYDAFDEESLMNYIKKRAEKICEVNRRTYANGAISVNISSSVGIAVASEAGKDFETIYKMADNALYRSKNGGKNCYNIYQGSK